MAPRSPCTSTQHSNEKEPAISDPRINERIRVPEVRLVGPGGEQVGVVRVEDALRLAREAELDLVEVSPDSRPPVVKIMDFGKFKYEQAQKAKEARRNQANTVLKEVRFRLKIDAHDYETKRKRAQGFLETGDKVKAMILFRGREQSRPEMGVKLLQRFAEDIAEFGVVESSPTIDGRNMVMIVGPLRSKSDAKAELNAARSAQRKADQEKRRIEAEKQAAHQAELDAARPPRPAAAPRPAATADFESRPPRSSRPVSGSRAPGASRSSDSRSSDSRPSYDSRSSSDSRPSSDSRSSSDSRPSTDSRPRQTARTVTPTPASAPRPASAPKPAAASAAAPAAPGAAPKPAAKPATPKPAAKPAVPSAAVKPAAPKAKPAAKPAGEPASE